MGGVFLDTDEYLKRVRYRSMCPAAAQYETPAVPAARNLKVLRRGPIVGRHDCQQNHGRQRHSDANGGEQGRNAAIPMADQPIVRCHSDAGDRAEKQHRVEEYPECDVLQQLSENISPEHAHERCQHQGL